jgi:hypothetical protein
MRWAVQHFGGQTKMAKVTAYSRKTPKKYKENKGGKKPIEREEEIRKGERRRRKQSLPQDE